MTGRPWPAGPQAEAGSGSGSGSAFDIGAGSGAMVGSGPGSATGGSGSAALREGAVVALALAGPRGGAAFSAWRQPSPNPRSVPASTPISANTMTNVMTTSSPRIAQPLVVASKLPNAVLHQQAGERGAEGQPEHAVAPDGRFGSPATGDPFVASIASAWPSPNATGRSLVGPCRGIGDQPAKQSMIRSSDPSTASRCSVSLSPLRTTTRSSAGTTIVYWPR